MPKSSCAHKKNEKKKVVRPSLTGIGFLLGIRVCFPPPHIQNSQENQKRAPTHEAYSSEIRELHKTNEESKHRTYVTGEGTAR